GPMVQSVVGGHTPVAFATLPSASAQIKDGLLRALAVTSTKRIAILPDVPTMEEAGVPGQVQEAPQCVWAPAGAPREIVDLLYREIARAVASPGLKEKMAAIGYEPSAVPPDEFKARIKADMPKWAKVIHDAGIRPERVAEALVLPKMPGGKWGAEDSHGRSGCGGRLCWRPYGTSRRGRDLHPSLARARRAHAKAWLTRDARHGRAGILSGRARPARDGRAATRQGETCRHRLRVHEVV